jgi:hypothetical protein
VHANGCARGGGTSPGSAKIGEIEQIKHLKGGKSAQSCRKQDLGEKPARKAWGHGFLPPLSAKITQKRL